MDVPPEMLDRLRAVCLGLPEAYEEEAWVGTRWCVRKRNFAHVLLVDKGWPPAYAKAAGSDGPIVVLTFRSADPGFAEVGRRAPFFKPVWFPDIFGMVLDDTVDWDEVRELITDSYRVLAPRKLAQSVD